VATTVTEQSTAEESTKQAVKTIACGTPDVNGVTVVTMLVCFLLFAHGAADALEHPAFRAPSLKRAGMQHLPARPRRKEQGGSNTSEQESGFILARMAQAPRARAV